MSTTNPHPLSAEYGEPLPLTSDRVRQVLAKSPYLPLRDLQCDYDAGVVSLRGKVPTFYLKQLAQTLMQRIAGVEQVANRIEVVEPGQTPLPRTAAISRQA